MTVQMIEQNGKPEWAVLPYNEYLNLVEKAEMLLDIQDFDQAMGEIEKKSVELIPLDTAYALIEGGNPIKTWREYRGLSQNELAQKSEISIPYLSQLEGNKRKGSLKVIAKLANALQISVDDLLLE
jgi:predicted transcriptional regulator